MALDPEATDLEGYLFPETYALPRDATADDLVEAMVTQFARIFDEELRAQAAARELTIREVVTLASLIQRETGLDEERPVISAVYTNRLGRRMPLQCDPTVIYALQLVGLFDGNLTRGQPAVRLALQHLPVSGVATRPDRSAGRRRPPGRASAGRREPLVFREPQRRVARLRRHAPRAQPQRAGVSGGVFPSAASGRAVAAPPCHAGLKACATKAGPGPQRPGLRQGRPTGLGADLKTHSTGAGPTRPSRRLLCRTALSRPDQPRCWPSAIRRRHWAAGRPGQSRSRAQQWRAPQR